MGATDINLITIYYTLLDNLPDAITNQVLLVVARLGSCVDAPEAGFEGLINEISGPFLLPRGAIYEFGDYCLGRVLEG